VSQLLENDVKAIVEGGWIQPENARSLKNKYKEKFSAIFCGYPDVTVEERQEFLRENNSNHYLASENSDCKLKKQIEDSKSYEKRAKENGFIFCNFSRIEMGHAALKNEVEDWYARSL